MYVNNIKNSKQIDTNFLQSLMKKVKYKFKKNR
jgi:hypothetical protein